MNGDDRQGDYQLEENVKKLLSATEPDLTMPDASKARTLAALTGRRARKRSRLRLVLGKGRKMTRSRITRYGTGAVAAAFVLFVVGIWSVGGNGSAVAFGKALERIRAARTLTYRAIVETGDKAPLIVHYIFMEPGHVRVSEENGRVWILDSEKRESLALDPKKKTAIHVEEMAQSVSAHDVIEGIKNLRGGTEEQLGTRDFDGRKALGFRVHKDDRDYSVWVDSRTGLPVRIETETGAGTGGNGLKARITLTDFQFDAELDESLFSLKFPKGYSVETQRSPELSRARRLSRRAESLANMGRIAKACHNYSKDHDGEWPDSLEELEEYGITREDLVNPGDPQRPVGYVYIRPSRGRAAPDQLLIHEAYDEWRDGVNAAFVDGHVEFVAGEEKFNRLLERGAGE